MRRAIQRLIQDPLALKLISGDFLEGDTVLVDVDAADGRACGSETSAVGQAPDLPPKPTVGEEPTPVTI